MIKTEKEYFAIVERMEELLKNPDNIENQEAKYSIELTYLSYLVVDSEECHFPIEKLQYSNFKNSYDRNGLKSIIKTTDVSTSKISQNLNRKRSPSMGGREKELKN